MNWHVRELAEPRGYNMHSLALQAGLSYLTVRGIWANTSTRTDLDSIAKLCKVLHCQPNDIIKLSSDPLPDEAAQLLGVLTPEPQTIATLCKRLRMRPAQLEQVLAENRDALVARGMQLHAATHSEVSKAIKLASISNADESTYYGRISKESV